MLIGLISDTHIGYPIKGYSRGGVDLETLPPDVAEAFRGVDLILHAGDIYIPSVLDELEAIAPVKAAWGDDDVAAHFGADNRLKWRHTLSFDGVTLWLTHDRPTFFLVSPEKLKNPAVLPPLPPDIIVHGDTHFAVVEYLNEIESNKSVLVVNPDSATFPDYVAKLGSVALLTINAGKVEARIVPLG